MIHFILGGARSGKSSFAEQWVLSYAEQSQKETVYIATATKSDDEMAHRIHKHQTNRDECWRLIECPLLLAETISAIKTATNTATKSTEIYLVDCLTLWLNNLLFQFESQPSSPEPLSHEPLTKAETKAKIKAETKASLIKTEEYLNQQTQLLVDALKNCEQDIVLVSNEVGSGIIPMGEYTRLYVDHCGWLNQAVAKIADRVTLVTAGIPLTIKETN